MTDTVFPQLDFIEDLSGRRAASSDADAMRPS